MNTTNHTPTPWTNYSCAIVANYRLKKDFGTVLREYRTSIAMCEAEPEEELTDDGCRAVGIRTPDFTEAEANAAFIVRACNSHDELVQALEAVLKSCSSNSKASLKAVIQARLALTHAKG